MGSPVTLRLDFSAIITDQSSNNSQVSFCNAFISEKKQKSATLYLKLNRKQAWFFIYLFIN